MIKNIVFDLGSVILKKTPSIVLEEVIIDNKIKQDLMKFFNNLSKLDFGYESLEEYYNGFHFDYQIDDKIKELLLNYYKYRPFNEEILKLIQNLKKQNYKVFILSNNNKETYNYLKELPIFKNIDGFIVSACYHTIKPNKELYIKLFETYNINPSECFFIDDQENNIATGIELGMKGYTLDIENKGINELVDILRENGVNQNL